MARTQCMLLAAVALICLASGCGGDAATGEQAVVTLRVGHVGHDHHLALFVAADSGGRSDETGRVGLRMVRDRELYDLMDGGKKLAEVEVIRVGGGAKMPTALAQGIIDVGLGGVAPVLASADSGAPVRIISPLHNRGDMFVLHSDVPATTWPEFVALARESERPVRIGYKDPVAVAKVIFEQALEHEGLTFSGDLSRGDVDVHMINTKGGGRLNVALAEGIVDGYAGNNPFPAIGREQGILRVVCDLEDLPPGTFRNHPCCCVAANLSALEGKRDAVEALLVALLQATDTINTQPEAAVRVATRWIGTSEPVERASIASSDYSMDPSPQWREQMALWIDALNRLDVLHHALAGLTEDEVAEKAYDLSFLRTATERLVGTRPGD